MCILNRSTLLSRYLVLITLLFFGFNITVSAAIVTTNQTTKADYTGEMPALNKLIVAQNIKRSDLEQQLLALGVPPEQVHSRLNSMTDNEIMTLASDLQQLPAGGDALTTIAFVFLVLVFTDIAGYTDLFPFVKKASRKNKPQHDGKVIDRRVNRNKKEPVVIEN